MSQTTLQLLDTTRLLLSDMKDQKWLKAQKLHFINQALQDVVSSEAIPYVRVSELGIRDGEYEYTFPEDMLEPVAMMLQSIEGSVVVSSSWRSLMINYDIQNSLTSLGSDVFWQEAANASGHVTLRDLVSDNKFLFTPKYQAELYNYTVHRQDDLPSAASEQEIWVDTFESENFVYQCNESYSDSADQAALILSSDYLASSVDMTFTFDSPGIRYCNIRIESLPASLEAPFNVSFLEIEYEGVFNPTERDNLSAIIFKIHPDDSSSDRILELIDSYNSSNPTYAVTATGSNATTGTVVDTTAEFVNIAAAKWTAQVIHLRYLAILPPLALDEDVLPAELPVLLRTSDCIPYIAAYKILDAVKGDERTLIMGRSFKKRADDIMERSQGHRAGNGPPYDVEPS